MNVRISIVICLICFSPIWAVATEDDVSIGHEIEESYLSGEIATFTYKELVVLGVSIEELDSNIGMVRLKISATEELSSLIENKEINVYLSLLDDNQLMVLMPRYEANEIEFMVSCKYVLRIAVSSKIDFNHMRAGVVYSYDYK